MRLLYATITLVIIINIYKTVESKMTIEQIKNTIKPYKNKCLKVTGVNPDLVEATKTGTFAKDPKLMCFTRCIYNMMKVIKNDDLSLKEIFKTVDIMVPTELEAKMKAVIEDCLAKANAKTSDLCEKSWLLTKCFYESDSSQKMDINGLIKMLKPMSKSCKTKTDMLASLMDGGVWPRDRSLMCYFRCMAVLLKVMNKEGKITLPEVNKQLNTLVIEELALRIKAILESCLKTVTFSEDSCEYAYNMIECGYNMDPALFLYHNGSFSAKFSRSSLLIQEMQ